MYVYALFAIILAVQEIKAGRVYGYDLQLPESKTNKGYSILLNISMDFLIPAGNQNYFTIFSISQD